MSQSITMKLGLRASVMKNESGRVRRWSANEVAQVMGEGRDVTCGGWTIISVGFLPGH